MQFLMPGQVASNLNLIAQIVMLIALYVGAYYARKQKIRPHHANIQTTVVIVNLFFIVFMMGITAYRILASGRPLTDHPTPFVIIHLILGIVAELLGIYLVLRMRTQLIPPSLRVKNFKRLMQFTLGLWTVAALLGLVIYGSFYLGWGR